MSRGAYKNLNFCTTVLSIEAGSETLPAVETCGIPFVSRLRKRLVFIVEWRLSAEKLAPMRVRTGAPSRLLWSAKVRLKHYCYINF